MAQVSAASTGDLDRARGVTGASADDDGSARNGADSWSAVAAGAAAAASLSLLLLILLILLILGAWLGLSFVSPWSRHGMSATSFGVSTIVCLTLVQLLASAPGGYFAGRLRAKWTGAHTDEVHFRDAGHGFVAWLLPPIHSRRGRHAFTASPVLRHNHSDDHLDRAVAASTARPIAQPVQALPMTATWSGASGKPKDAITVLKTDHTALGQLSAEYENLRSASRMKALLTKICMTPRVHAQIEQEIFYPSVRTALKDRLLVPESAVEHEHASVNDLIAQREGVEPDGENFDAKIKMPSEYVMYQVKEERAEMFPKVKASSIDLVALGASTAARWQALLANAA